MKSTLAAAALSVAVLLTAGCSVRQHEREADSIAAMQGSPLLEVEIPDSIIDPQARADYALLHFWDTMNFGDRRLTADSAFMATNFREFARWYDSASPDGAAYATASLLKRLETYNEVYHRFVALAEEYIIDPKSDTGTILGASVWTEQLASSPLLTGSEKERYKYKLKLKSRNAPGTQATDFNFTLRDGTPSSLYDSPCAPYTLLAFYAPDCDTCHDMIARVRGDKRLTQYVDGGQVSVVLVSVVEGFDQFKADARSYPSRWTVGYDTSGVVDNDLYAIDHTPTLYLLDAHKKVLLRDATVDQLIDYARSH